MSADSRRDLQLQLRPSRSQSNLTHEDHVLAELTGSAVGAERAAEIRSVAPSGTPSIAQLFRAMCRRNHLAHVGSDQSNRNKDRGSHQQRTGWAMAGLGEVFGCFNPSTPEYPCPTLPRGQLLTQLHKRRGDRHKIR